MGSRATGDLSVGTVDRRDARVQVRERLGHRARDWHSRLAPRRALASPAARDSSPPATCVVSASLRRTAALMSLLKPCFSHSAICEFVLGAEFRQPVLAPDVGRLDADGSIGRHDAIELVDHLLGVGEPDLLFRLSVPDQDAIRVVHAHAGQAWRYDRCEQRPRETAREIPDGRRTTMDSSCPGQMTPTLTKFRTEVEVDAGKRTGLRCVSEVIDRGTCF